MRNQIDKIIITAMDRFVWFVILVVMSHLVTEFTRVTGYSRGSRNDVILVNDSLMQPVKVQNMVLYPGQDYGLYERPSQYSSNSNSNSNNKQQQQQLTATNEQDRTISVRPIIDSIFEIPISTLRAVNNLVTRLTGNYQHMQTPNGLQQKSAAGAGAVSTASLTKDYQDGSATDAVANSRKATKPIKITTLMREENA